MVSMNFEREKKDLIRKFRVRDIRYDFGVDMDEEGIGEVTVYPIIDIEIQSYILIDWVIIDYKVKFKD